LTSERLRNPRRLARLASAATGSCRRAVSRRGQNHLTPLGPPCRIAKRLHDVFALQIGVVGEDLVETMPGANLAHTHSNRHAHAADTCLAAHDFGLLGDAIELR